MKKTKLMALALIACLLLTLLGGCGGSSTPQSPGSSEAGEEDIIRIGFVGPLTGDAAAWGIAQRNAIEMCISKQNEQGGLLGKQMQLFYYDNREDPVETVNAARKLIEQDNVAVILGPNNSVCAQAMSSICDDYKVPMVCTNTPLEKITLDDNGNVRPYVFRAIMIQRAYVSSIVEYMYDIVGARTAACLYILSNDTNIAIVRMFEEQWKARGGEILASETTASIDDVDFRAQLTKFKELDPDVIFSPFTYKQIILMAQQARELGVTSQFAGCDTWFQVSIPTSAGEQVEGCIAIASLDVNDPVLDPLKQQYLEFFGEDQTLRDGGTDPYYGYDTYKILEAAILDAGAADSESIRNALENVKDVEGCVGKLTMDPATHNPSRELAIVTIEKKEDGSYGYKTLGKVYEGKITLN